jgi:acyl dehydratase
MAKQLCYEDVTVGSDVVPLVKETSKRLSAIWAGACGDYDEYHYDDTIANSMGFPGAIVNGKLMAAFLTEMMTEWIGERGMLKKFACQFRQMHPVGVQMICKGKVTNKYMKDKEGYVECEIWTEKPNGEKVTPGTATVILPTKG